MNKTYNVVVVGELNVDLILNEIDEYPQMGKEILARQMAFTLGSSSAIFASNLSTLGSPVTFIGKLGRDNFGEYILSRLKASKVDIRHTIVSEGCSTGATVAMNFGEDRAMVTYPGAMHELTLRDIPEQTLLEAKHLHVSSVFLQAGLKKDLTALFRKARQLGLTTSLDPQWDPSGTWDLDLKALLPFVDVFMPNLAEIKALTGMDTLETAVGSIASFNTICVIKNGNEGAWLWDGKKLVHQAPFLNREVADCIGAGDSFNAGFIYQFLRDRPATECLKFGALAGAVNTTRAGGTAAFETIETFKQIAKSHFNYTV